MNPLRLGILGSGKGTNCRAILERIKDGELQAKAAVIISDVFDAPILDIARSPDFTLEKLKEALKRSSEIH